METEPKNLSPIFLEPAPGKIYPPVSIETIKATAGQDGLTTRVDEISTAFAVELPTLKIIHEKNHTIFFDDNGRIVRRLITYDSTPEIDAYQSESTYAYDSEGRLLERTIFNIFLNKESLESERVRTQTMSVDYSQEKPIINYDPTLVEYNRLKSPLSYEGYASIYREQTRKLFENQENDESLHKLSEELRAKWKTYPRKSVWQYRDLTDFGKRLLVPDKVVPKKSTWQRIQKGFRQIFRGK